MLSGSHAGVSIGEDGPSQMALEDIASLRAIHGSTVVHPSDANQTAKLVAALADRDGISFIRTLRGKTPVRTARDEDVRIGGSRIAHEGDDVAIIACGITLDEAVKAAERLADDGVHARVLDAYSIKPIDADAVRAAARDCGAIVTVEDHAPEGGLGDAVLDALAAERRARARRQARRARDPRAPARRRSCCTRAKIDADAIADAPEAYVAAPGCSSHQSSSTPTSRRRRRRTNWSQRAESPVMSDQGSASGSARPPARRRSRTPPSRRVEAALDRRVQPARRAVDDHQIRHRSSLRVVQAQGEALVARR